MNITLKNAVMCWLYPDFGKRVKELLKNNDANAITEYGEPLIVLMALLDDYKSVTLLIEAGANPDLAGKFGLTALHSAVVWGDLRMARYLLDNNASPNVKDELAGITSLAVAIWRGDIKMISLLLKYKLDPNIKGYGDNSLLICAAGEGNVEIIDLLIANGADINSSNIVGVTPLMVAVNSGNFKAIKHLLRNGADINARTIKGNTVLVEAISGKSLKLVKELIKYGAQINTRNEDGCSPLHLAIHLKQYKIALLLLKSGATIINAGYLSDHKDTDNYQKYLEKDNRMLGLAVRRGYNEIVESLLKQGASPDAKYKHNPILIHAIRYKNIKAVMLFLKYGANVNAVDNRGLTALFYALVYYQPHLIELLLSYNANINIKNPMGDSVLTMAAQKNLYKAAELFISRGIEVNNRDYLGGTALIEAVLSESVSIVKLLLENNADPNIVPYYGKSALTYALELEPKKAANKSAIIALLRQYGGVEKESQLILDNLLNLAAYEGDLSKVEYLLKEKMDAYTGATALIYAIKGGNKDVVQFLLDSGIDPNACSRIDGMTPLMAAAANNEDLTLIKLLLEKGAFLDLEDFRRNTAIFYAVINNRPEALKYLISLGAEIYPTSAYNYGNEQMTLIEWARKYQHPEVIKILEGKEENILTFDLKKILLAKKDELEKHFLYTENRILSYT